MRQLFLDKGNLVVKEVAQPLLDDHSILVAVKYVYVSAGTEIAKINASDGLFSNVPHKVKRVLKAVASHATEHNPLQGKLLSLGYSCSGQVVAVGKKVTKFAPGDLIACADPGYAHFADIVCIPQNLAVRVRSQDNLKASSLITIASMALHGIRRAQLQLGERVCVVGLNLLGQLTVQLAKLSGCYVYATSNVPERIQLAQQNGADHVFHIDQHDFIKEIDLLTEKHGVDTTIITTSSESDQIIDNAISVTRKKGRIVIVGCVGLNIKRDLFYAKEIDIVGSSAYGPGSYEVKYQSDKKYEYPYAYVRWTDTRNMQECLQLIEQKKLRVDTLITHETDLSGLQSTYARIENKSLLGAVLSYESDMNADQMPQLPTIPLVPKKRFKPAVSEKISVGLIGAGSFAQETLLPLLSKTRTIAINTIVDADLHNSLRIAREYGVKNAFSHEGELYQENNCDVVVVATPHIFHFDQAVKALRQGKAVFLETPMVTDFAQLQQLCEILKSNPAPFCVDYSRSFSPFMQKVKKVIQQRSTPLMINYRMNLSTLGKQHWVQTDVGAGRIIGDACHIIDLFCFLTNAEPLSVSVEALHTSRDDIFPTDNFSTQISFNDGSVCSLFFNAIGHPDSGSERMELFYDSKSILMEDYMELYGFGLSSWFNETVTTPDKGYRNLIQQFFNQLNQKEFSSPLPFDRLCTVAKLTLLIDQLACEGGGKKQVE